MKVGLPTTIWGCFEIHDDVDWLKRLGPAGVVMRGKIYFAQPISKVPDWVIKHELTHAYQQIREGFLKFTLKYFYYQLRYGYVDNPFEVEAREAQSREYTQYEEELLWKLREGSTLSPNALAQKSNT